MPYKKRYKKSCSRKDKQFYIFIHGTIIIIRNVKKLLYILKFIHNKKILVQFKYFSKIMIHHYNYQIKNYLNKRTLHQNKRCKMSLLLKELKQIQGKKGYISEDSMKKLSKKMNIPVAKIYAAATFYSQLHTKPQGKHIIEICNSPSCYLNGSLNIIKYLEKKLKIKSGQTTEDKRFSLYICSCIGCCDKAPAMKIGKEVYTSLTKEKIDEIIKGLK
ncbi:NADH-quinone oxidoreductase subunit NuoE [Candidatus Woesearchaeota archaeon]|nr:NADH-quinone oxidoreductase subunit NuoE [Candidatus Woesearchaeota archaeon]